MTPANNAPTALVTGAAHGIGRAVAHALADLSYRVVLLDRDLAAISQLAAQLSGVRNIPAQAYGLDIRDTQAIGQTFQQAGAAFGKLDLLVNCAGIYPSCAALDMQESDWDQVLDVNLKGTFFCCQAMARHSRDTSHPAAIINLASTSAYSARVGAAHYAASKAALVMLTRSLAQEFAPLSVRVNAVAPGLIEVREGQVTPAYRNQFIAQVPSGRIGAPQDIAQVVAFLASSQASYINGECIVVDGGFLAGRTLQSSGTTMQ